MLNFLKAISTKGNENINLLRQKGRNNVDFLTKTCLDFVPFFAYSIGLFWLLFTERYDLHQTN